MDIYILVLRIIHIFGGVFWVGAAWMTAGFLLPTAEAIGSDAEKFMTYINVKRRYPTFIGIAAGFNMLAGFLLYWRDSAGLRLIWITTPTGLAETFGALCAIAGSALGFRLVAPLINEFARMGHELHSSGKPPSGDQLAKFQQVQKRLDRAERIVAGLLGLALLAMATARYL
jgi:uncharacterized membrane protein